MNNIKEIIEIARREVISTVFTGRIGRARVFLFILVIPICIYLSRFFGEELNIFQYYRICPKEYSFFSGSDGGSYSKIADVLIARKNINAVKIVRNEPTDGGYSNPIKVLTNENSFGFVEEDVFPKTDVIRNLITYVTPIYLERMHFLYNKDSTNISNPVLTLRTNEELLRFISNSRISVGVIGGGTNVISDYILSELNEQIKSINSEIKTTKIDFIGKNIARYKTEDAYDKLKERGGISAMFFIGGAPNPSIDTLIKYKNIGMISIESSFTSLLNKKYNLEFKNANFDDRYDNTENILTFGTYCFLITNKTTPPSDILLLLENLQNTYSDKNTDSRIGKILSEFNYVKSYESSESEKKNKIWNNIIAFLITLIAAWGSVLFFTYKWLSQKRKENQLDKKLNDIAASIPKIEEFTVGSESAFALPDISKEPKVIIDIRIVPSISKLFILRKEASEIYTSGSISEEHFQFAMQRIDELVSKFRKEMFLRLHDYILTNKGKGVLSEDDLRRYLTGEYIDFDSYKILMEVVKK